VVSGPVSSGAALVGSGAAGFSITEPHWLHTLASLSISAPHAGHCIFTSCGVSLLVLRRSTSEHRVHLVEHGVNLVAMFIYHLSPARHPSEPVRWIRHSSRWRIRPKVAVQDGVGAIGEATVTGAAVDWPCPVTADGTSSANAARAAARLTVLRGWKGNGLARGGTCSNELLIDGLALPNAW